MSTPIVPIQVKNPLGHKCAAYVGKTTGSLDGLTKVPCVQTASVQYTSDQIDLTTRDSGGWKEPVPGEKSATAEITFLLVERDKIQGYFFDVYNADEPSTISATFVTGEDGVGHSGDWIVTDINEDQPRNEGVPWKISLASFGKIVRFNVGGASAASVETDESY